MAAIGPGWADGAWVQASWTARAWGGSAIKQLIRGFTRNVGRLMNP